MGTSWGVLGRLEKVTWDVLARFGASWGGLEAVLGRLGVVLGRSWADLGASWSGLGVSWGGLGSHFVAVGRTFKIIEKPLVFQCFLHVLCYC